MLSAPLVLLLALTAPLDAKRSVPVPRAPAATGDASAASSPLGDAELRDQVESYLGSLHQAVPADDLMQAFIYRHLVPAKSLLAAVTRRDPTIVPRGQ